MHRRALLALPLSVAATAPARALPPPSRGEDAEPLLRALRREGGRALLFRHADTRRTGCDTTTDWRDAARQRHLSPEGREQARRLGEVLREWRLPVAGPVLASPAPRALETARLAWGDAEADERLLSDEFAAERFGEVVAAQRALLAEAAPPGAVRLLFGHLSSAVLVGGERRPTQAEFPEGSALVLRPGGAVEAVLELAPIPGGGAHGCR